MNRRASLLPFSLQDSRLLLSAITSSPRQPLFGYSAESSRAERQWEEKPAPSQPRQSPRYMEHLLHVPTTSLPYDSRNAEWIAAKFKEFGLDTHIEQFDVLFPRQGTRVELVEGGPKFVAKLQEPVFRRPHLKSASDSSPLTTLTRSTATSRPLVYVNTGIPEATSSSSAWDFREG